jgi:ATP dependent DNA ligase domain
VVGLRQGSPALLDEAPYRALAVCPNLNRRYTSEHTGLSFGTTVRPSPFDGYRVQIHLRDAAVKVFTRRGNDWTNRSRKIAADAWHVNAGSAIIDGEVVMPAANGTTDFSVLQNELKGRSKEIVLVTFDLLYLNGYDLRNLPLIERKALLKKLVAETVVQFSESFEVDGQKMYQHACKVGLEGVVSKVRDGRQVQKRATGCNHENSNNSPMCVFMANTTMIGAADDPNSTRATRYSRTPSRTTLSKILESRLTNHFLRFADQLAQTTHGHIFRLRSGKRSRWQSGSMPMLRK